MTVCNGPHFVQVYAVCSMLVDDNVVRDKESLPAFIIIGQRLSAVLVRLLAVIVRPCLDVLTATNKRLFDQIKERHCSRAHDHLLIVLRQNVLISGLRRLTLLNGRETQTEWALPPQHVFL